MKVKAITEAEVIQSYEVLNSPSAMRAVLMYMGSSKGGRVLGIPHHHMHEVSKNLFKYLIDGRMFRVTPRKNWEYKVDELAIEQ